MSDSVQSQVLDKAVQLLGGAAQSAWRCRFTPFSAEELVAGADNVLPEDELPEFETTDDLGIVFRFHVRHTLQARDGVDKAVDARYVRGYRQLTADPTMGGLVRFIRYVGRKWEYERGELHTVALVVTYQVAFSTSRSDPSVAGY